MADYSAAAFWFDVAQFTLTALVCFYVYITNRSRVTNERIGLFEKDVDKRLDDHAQRIVRVESILKHAPTHEDIGVIHDKVNEMNGNIENVKGAVAGIARNLELISQHLLNGSKNQ